MVWPLRGGPRGLNGCATKKKRTFFNVRKKVSMATKPRGGGVKGPIGRATKKRSFFFCGFPYLFRKFLSSKILLNQNVICRLIDKF